ncbi:acetate/propionate family kinase [Sinorhizobium numidicum]|uniref:Acetate kinase n=1 Tax=Sinorhizobium numidicum TaxID=680248 RepID=A0ABY8CMD8_9HYPH|nr:acetate/propionate family kinase [Sinorhizobium numidicum]WEX73830.1 acetate/propionate family kinase [Sinorhizobium numidicum]WEX79814.1 acetate/propionate family kinase [Sinorhizobium numidicum]
MTSKEMAITFNAGSSTLKLGLFEIDRSARNTDGRAEFVSPPSATRVGRVLIDLHDEPPTLHLVEGPLALTRQMKSKVEALNDLIDEVFETLSAHFRLQAVNVIGHRVVHGGGVFTAPTLLDDQRIEAITALAPLAPLHQNQALRFVHAVRHLRPSLLQTASFDTAFHASQDDLVRRLAIPRALHDQGIKRYGFHGLSYKFIAAELRRRAPEVAAGMVVAAHLGSGASLCALENGVSRDCSMGFSTLDGVPMATRPGWLDPGVVLHLIGERRQSLKDVEDMLYHQSGLLGVSAISADTRELLSDGGPEARQAIDLFVLRIAGEIGRLSMTLGGLDAVVFTGGIGEHQPQIRAAVAKRLNWMGLLIDEPANAANARLISRPESRVAAFVIPTDEEQVIAEEALSVLIEEI